MNKCNYWIESIIYGLFIFLFILFGYLYDYLLIKLNCIWYNRYN